MWYLFKANFKRVTYLLSMPIVKLAATMIIPENRYLNFDYTLSVTLLLWGSHKSSSERVDTYLEMK